MSGIPPYRIPGGETGRSLLARILPGARWEAMPEAVRELYDVAARLGEHRRPLRAESELEALELHARNRGWSPPKTLPPSPRPESRTDEIEALREERARAGASRHRARQDQAWLIRNCNVCAKAYRQKLTDPLHGIRFRCDDCGAEVPEPQRLDVTTIDGPKTILVTQPEPDWL